jgi:hypothetical protein
MLLLKIQVVSYSFDVAESHYKHQTALLPTNVKVEVFKLKNYFCNKKVIHLVSNILKSTGHVMHKPV